MLEETPESQTTPAEPSSTQQQPAPPSHPQPLANTIFLGADGLRAGWGLLLFFALFFAFSSGATMLIQIIGSHLHHASRASSGVMPGDILIGELCSAASVLLATGILARIERRPLLGYGLAPARWLPLLLKGLAWGFAFLSLLVLILRQTGLLVFDGRLLTVASAFRFGAYWFAAFLAVGLFEEIFFRGYMQFTLARGFAGVFSWLGAPNYQALGFWTAAFLLSFGFGFTHRTNAGESPIGLLAAGLGGGVFCLSLWRTGSLWWAIGLHASWDWAQSYFYGTPDSGTLVSGHLFATHTVGSIMLSGGRTGPEGSVYVLPVIVLMPIVIFLTLPRTHSGYVLRDATDQTTALDLPKP